MSDSASKKSEVQASNFAKSQAANSDIQPNIGDLSAIQTDIEDPKSASKNVGDLQDINEATKSDVLSDITLLEEAFAELEDGEDNAENSIPVLNSTIEQPSNISSDIEIPTLSENVSQSIPILDEKATEIADLSAPAANSESLTSEVSNPSVPVLDESENSQKISKISEFEQISSSEPALGDINLNSEPIIDPITTSSEPKITTSEPAAFSEPMMDTITNISEPKLSESEPAAFSESAVKTPSIENSPISEPMMDAITNISEPKLSESEPAAFSEPAIETSNLENATISDPLMDLPDMDSLVLTSQIESAESQLNENSNSTVDESKDEIEMASVITTFDAAEEEITTDAVKPSTEAVENLWTDSSNQANTSSFKVSAVSTPIEETQSTMSHPAESNTVQEEATLSSIAEKFDSSPIGDTQPDINNDVFSSNSTQTSIEDKIAKAAGDNHSTISNDIPLTNEKLSGVTETELAQSVVEDLTKSQTSAPLGELLPQQSPAQEQNAQESVDSASQFNMSIPFELHSQLSKKIDELVLDATMSLTNELQHQLSAQLEVLLGNAVESVLPKLVDQMANELRTEVKGRVKQQLPIIVNDVLGRTRLS